MSKIKFIFIAVISISACFIPVSNVVAQGTIRISTPMPPPEWAMLERQLIDNQNVTLSDFYDHFYDETHMYCINKQI